METVIERPGLWTEDFLSNVELFADCTPAEIHRLACHLRRQSFQRGKTIIFKGLISHELYILASGRVSVYGRRKKSMRFLSNLEPGDYFGEISLIKKCAATATVIAAAEQTDVLILDFDPIKEVLANHPRAWDILQRKIQMREAHRNEILARMEETTADPAWVT